MRLLLDTHVLIWWWTDRSRLPVGIIALIENEEDSVFISAASAWEITTKNRTGKLPEMQPYIPRYHELVTSAGFTSLAIDAAHGLRAGQYDAPHRDPFDRMLAAQAEVENLTLITRDPAFVAFPCRTLW